MWGYRIKKWVARLCFVGLLVLGLTAIGQFEGDPPVWVDLVVGLSVAAGSIAAYEMFKPLKPVSPADGLRTETDKATVGTSGWQEEMPASDQSIRAAMLTCHERTHSNIRVVRPDNRAIIAYWQSGGWALKSADVGSRVDSIGIRYWNGIDLEPVKFSWLKVFNRSLDGDLFGNRDTEEVLNAFASGAEKPEFLAWQKIERD